MKRIAAIAIFGWLLLAGSTWASQVTNVALSYQDGSTVARIDVQGPIRFTHQTEVPKDGRPDRVIVDVLSATHALGAKEFFGLPSCVVTGIRSSQYAVSPEKIVRIVFDLGTTPVYQVESDDHAINIRFSHREPQSFAAWSSNGASTAPEPKKVTPEVAEAPRATVPAPVTVAVRNEIIEKDRLASLAEKTSEKAQPKPEPVKVVKEVPAVTPTTVDFSGRAFAEGWDASQQWKPKATSVFPSAITKPESVTVAKAPAPTPAPVEKKPIQLAEKKPLELAVSKPIESVQTAQKPQVTSNVEPPQAAPEVVQPKVEFASQPPVVKTNAQPSAVEPTFPPLDEQFSYPPLQFPMPSQASAPQESPALAQAPMPVVTEPTPTAAAAEQPKPSSTETPKIVDAATETKPTAKEAEKANLLDEADFAPAVELPATVKPEDMSQIVVVDTSASAADKTPQRATARFRREAQSDKIRGTMVAEFPERLVIQYQTAGQRDPFDPIIDDSKSFNNPVENRIPNVEGLKLVGILESQAGSNSALFEDKGGFSYILQSGDKVRNGYVLRVEPEQVYFQIFEYGWSRTVALTMEY